MSIDLESVKKKFFQLSIHLSDLEIKNFSGVGLVLYHEMNNLSQYHCNLVDDDKEIPKVKLGTQDLISYLIEIADYRHPYHDGFHFINSKGILTHVAQFFSPPVNKYIKNVRGHGARTYCAQSGSLVEGVLMVSSVSSRRNIHLFSNGFLLEEKSIASGWQ